MQAQIDGRAGGTARAAMRPLAAAVEARVAPEAVVGAAVAEVVAASGWQRALYGV